MSDDDWSDYEEEHDRLDRSPERRLFEANKKIAHLEKQLRETTAVTAEVMETISETGQEDFVLLKAPKVRKWWQQYREAKLDEAKFWVDKTAEETREHKEIYEAYQEILDEREAEYNEVKAKYKL